MIKIFRGDTEKIKVRFLNEEKQEENPSFVSDGDYLTLSVRDKLKGELKFKKVLQVPDSVFTIAHEDTKDLKIMDYEFDIEFRKPDYSIVKTLVVGTFRVSRDVTYDLP